MKGLIIKGERSIAIPKSSSLQLKTVTSEEPCKVFVNGNLIAVLSELNSNACLQLDFTAEDSPLTIATQGGSAHFVVTTKGSVNLDTGTPLETNTSTAASGPIPTEDATLVKSTKIKSKRKVAEPSATRVPSKKSKVEAEVPIVIAQPPVDAGKRKRWKVVLEDDQTGLLVPTPKQVTKATGVLITDYIVGKGAIPKLGARLRVIYEAMFPSGHIFDRHLTRKKPFIFRLGTNQVIRGLDHGLEGMRIGGAREIVIPPALG